MGVPYVANKNLVANSDAAVQLEIHTAQRSQSPATCSLGHRKTDTVPYGAMAELDFHQFVYEILLRRKIPKTQAAHISKNAWHYSTSNTRKPLLKRWFSFMKEKNLKYIDLSLYNIMSF